MKLKLGRSKPRRWPGFKVIQIPHVTVKTLSVTITGHILVAKPVPVDASHRDTF